MKNVIVVALGKSRYAVELRWVREVFTLGHVTPVPQSPPPIAGVVNFRGSIMPVLELMALLGQEEEDGEARRGDGAVLVQVEELRAAFRVDNVDEVSTLKELEGREGYLLDSAGREVSLIDPPALLDRALDVVQRHRGEKGEETRGG